MYKRIISARLLNKSIFCSFTFEYCGFAFIIFFLALEELGTVFDKICI